jgi:hypothetical protein
MVNLKFLDKYYYFKRKRPWFFEFFKFSILMFIPFTVLYVSTQPIFQEELILNQVFFLIKIKHENKIVISQPQIEEFQSGQNEQADKYLKTKEENDKRIKKYLDSQKIKE